MKRICVYCGSSRGRRPDYVEGARALAVELVKRDLGLVYGGASVGIMGRLADAVLERSGEVVGVIPQVLADKEIYHPGLTDLRVVDSIQERKAVMADVADGFIALPGGLGTLDELFEVWTWAQLGFHQKPCALLNICGYYDTLTEFLDHTVAERFVKDVHRAMLLVETSPGKLLDRMLAYRPPVVEKWLDRNEE